MSEETAQKLVDAIYRQSVMIADDLGLSLTADELKAVYEVIGKCYIVDKILTPHRFTVGDWLQMYEGKED